MPGLEISRPGSEHVGGLHQFHAPVCFFRLTRKQLLFAKDYKLGVKTFEKFLHARTVSMLWGGKTRWKLRNVGNYNKGLFTIQALHD